MNALLLNPLFFTFVSRGQHAFVGWEDRDRDSAFLLLDNLVRFWAAAFVKQFLFSA